MTDNTGSSKPPVIGKRAEIIDIMHALASNRITVDTAHEKLRSIIIEYLPENASLRHGALVGMMLFYALFPPRDMSNASVGAARRKISRDPNESINTIRETSWAQAATLSPSPFAPDRGIWDLTADVKAHCDDEEMLLAAQMLYKKLRTIFTEDIIIS